MELGGPGSDRQTPAAQPPLIGRSKPPKVWGSLRADEGMVVVQLEGWRVLWATKRTMHVPLDTVVAVDHDPYVHERVSTRLRRRPRRVRGAPLFRVGAYHGLDGWSFWSCGMARNAVVVETSGTRYRFLVVEVADPHRVVTELREAAGLAPATGSKVRSISEAPRRRRSGRPRRPADPGPA